MNALTSAARLGLFFLLGQGVTVEAAEIQIISLPAYTSLLEKLDPLLATTTGHRLVIESRIVLTAEGAD